MLFQPALAEVGKPWIPKPPEQHGKSLIVRLSGCERVSYRENLWR